jgi:diguanylate cyclase (GGDEF)-like protein/PAS domain S-box-containing protein
MDGRFLRVNRSLCEIFGYSEKELVGRSVKGLSHPEDRDKSDAARARVRSGELESTRLQKRYLRKDGATVWVDLTVALARDAAGKSLYEIAVFDDDTERKNAEWALRESEARFRSLTEMSSDFYWESDAEHRLTKRGSADKTLSSVSIFRQGAQIGQRRWEIPYLSPDEAGWQAHRAVLDAHRPFRDFELSRLGADGTERHISISGDPVFDAFGAFTGFRGVGTDITERKRTEQALRDGAEKLRLFADNVPAMTVLWDENLRCRFASKVFAEFYGLAVDDIVGKHLREILGEEVFRETEGHAAQVLQGYPVTFQRTRKLQNGESRFLEIKLLPHIGDQKKVLGCFDVTTDITERKLEEERIQRVAHHDSLTGLPNRLLFNDRLNQAMNLAKRESRQFALLYLDLDKFKPVNDTLGHTAGDELLRVVATRIRHQVRESDTVARVGGDEFTVILPDIARREEAEIVARKIIDALAMPFELGGQRQSVDIGTSIGIALYPADARDADALVRAADAAMYSAKQAGNSFCFYAVS